MKEKFKKEGLKILTILWREKQNQSESKFESKQQPHQGMWCYNGSNGIQKGKKMETLILAFDFETRFYLKMG